MRRGSGSLWIAAAAAAVLGCGNESGTYEPVSVGGNVVIKVVGVVVSDADQTPLGFSDGELTREGNGGLPVLKCVTREQVIGFQLESL